MPFKDVKNKSISFNWKEILLHSFLLYHFLMKRLGPNSAKRRSAEELTSVLALCGFFRFFFTFFSQEFPQLFEGVRFGIF